MDCTARFFSQSHDNQLQINQLLQIKHLAFPSIKKQFAFPALNHFSGNSGLHVKEFRAQELEAWNFHLNFSSHPRPITGLALIYGLLWFARVSCPQSEWQPGGEDFFLFCACVCCPVELKGLYVTEREGPALQIGGAAVQDSSEAQRGVRERRWPSVNQLGENTH